MSDPKREQSVRQMTALIGAAIAGNHEAQARLAEISQKVKGSPKGHVLGGIFEEAAQRLASNGQPQGVAMVSDGAFMEFADNTSQADSGGPTEGASTGPVVDDFQQIIAQRQAAAYIPGHGNVDDLLMNARFREIRREADDTRAPYVRTNPASCNEALFGNQTLITSGQLSNYLAQWTGSDEETANMTITFSNVGAIGGGWPTALDGTGMKPYSYRPYGVIRWGTRGFAAEAIVDVSRGMPIKISASFVNVAVGMDPAPTGYAAGAMQLAGNMSFGTPPFFAPVTRTLYVDDLKAGSVSTALVVPSFAKDLTISLPIYANGDPSKAYVQAIVRDTAGTQIGEQFLVGNTTYGNQSPYRLPNDAYDIQIRQINENDATVPVRVIFGLAL